MFVVLNSWELDQKTVDVTSRPNKIDEVSCFSVRTWHHNSARQVVPTRVLISQFITTFMPFRAKSKSLEVQPLQFIESHPKYTSKDCHFHSLLFQTLSVCI